VKRKNDFCGRIRMKYDISYPLEIFSLIPQGRRAAHQYSVRTYGKEKKRRYRGRQL
jgi:hypothetical protein